MLNLVLLRSRPLPRPLSRPPLMCMLLPTPVENDRSEEETEEQYNV